MIRSTVPGLVRLALLFVLTPLCVLRAQGVCDTNKKDRITTSVSPAARSWTPVAADFNAGFTGNASYSVTVSTNRPQVWYLCLTSISTDAGTVNGYTKALSDLEFSIDGTTWTPFSTTGMQVRTGTGTITVNVLVRVKLAYALDQPQSPTTPGTYGPVSFEFQALM